MAQNKYDLLLVNTLTDKAIQDQPWYKERIRTKLIKSLRPEDVSKFLVTKNWTFLKDGLDDFRDGLPPPVHDGDIVQRPKGLAPNLTGEGSSEDLENIKQTVNKHRFTKEDICYSKLTPQQRQRHNHIDEIEFGLLQHPLALYPHLEEGVPPDLFEDIVDLLDPDMNLASDDEDEFSDEGRSTYSPERIGSAAGASINRQTSQTQEIDTHKTQSKDTVKSLYKWLPKSEDTSKKSKRKQTDVRSKSPSQDQHIRSVTQDFCTWVSDLGGESNNIEESTIYSLFASGYETKPALSVPIHVVELTNVPPELRMSAQITQQQQNAKSVPVTKKEEKQWSYSFGNYEPSWAKFNYGAWYLSPKTWKKREKDALLLDPKQLKEQDSTEMKRKTDALDQELAPIHGSGAFMEFINKKGTRKPEFLTRVAEIQHKQRAEEERLRIEQEAKARKLAQRKSAKQTA